LKLVKKSKTQVSRGLRSIMPLKEGGLKEPPNQGPFPPNKGPYRAFWPETRAYLHSIMQSHMQALTMSQNDPL